MMKTVCFFALLGLVSTENATDIENTCDLEPWESGPWSLALEEWASSPVQPQGRQGRILSLPAANGYYVTDRVGLIPPPPPPPSVAPSAPTLTIPVPRPYDEWHPPGSSKILNKPNNPYKDKFKPSYPPPQPNQQYQDYNYPSPPPSRPASDRVDAPTSPQKQVSETDLVLLGAIEKLTYRLDLMEKRLRKMEESMHYLVAGSEPKQEPCVANFTRVSGTCYHFSPEIADWKSASLACRKLRANLIEFDSFKKRKVLTSTLQTDKRLKDTDWWTGGLNPGLLWIWTHSARPVNGNSTNTTESVTIVGEGRCLAIVHDPAVKAHVYRGQDCGYRHRYICEKEEDKTKLSNEIQRVAKKLILDNKGRKPKIMWTDD